MSRWWLNSYISGFEKKAIQKVGLYYTRLTIIDTKFLYIFFHIDQSYVTISEKQNGLKKIARNHYAYEFFPFNSNFSDFF